MKKKPKSKRINRRRRQQAPPPPSATSPHPLGATLGQRLAEERAAKLEAELIAARSALGVAKATLNHLEAAMAATAFREWSVDQCWEIARGKLGNQRWLFLRIADPTQPAISAKPNMEDGPPGGRLVAFGLARAYVGPRLS